MYCEKINLIIFICQRSILILFGLTNRRVTVPSIQENCIYAQKFRLFGLLNKKLNMCQFDYNYIQIRNLIFGNISGN